ncbi:MAG: MFS transporter, partial [Clostridiales bacterium]|nr:MFS transporter [Clostridiales bacterium]
MVQKPADNGESTQNTPPPTQNTPPPQRWKGKFLTMTAGQTLSLIGSSAVQFALIWWLTKRTSSPFMLSMAGLAAFLPQLLLGPFAGVWIDRMKRKRVIIGADLFVGACATVYAATMFVWEAPVWSVFVVLGLRACGGVFHTPAVQSVVPLLVPPQKIVRANAVAQFMQSGAFLLGPVFGALMYAAIPLPYILLTDLAGALIAVAATVAVKIPELAPRAEKTKFFDEFKTGFKIFIGDKKLAVTAFSIAAAMIFFMPLTSYFPLMTSDYFKGTEFHAAFAESLWAAGMLAGAVITGAAGTIKNKLVFARLMFLFVGLESVICGLLPPTSAGFWVYAAASFVMGATLNAYGIPFTAYLQETVPPQSMGRVFSFLGTLMSLAMPLGLLISGPAAETRGVA